MMFGLPLGMIVESLVSVLLLLTIGYCVVLNARLKRLHADRDSLRKVVTDLVQATTLANSAIQELKQTAVEADMTLTARLEEAERFGIELASHVHAGQGLIEKIVKIAAAARKGQALPPVGAAAPAAVAPTVPDVVVPSAANEEAATPNRLASALQQLAMRQRSRGAAA